MSLVENINQDLKSAMKAKEKLEVDTLRTVIAQLKNERIKLQKDLTPEQELAIVMNAAKKRKEAIEIYKSSVRHDLLEKEKKELEIISKYLPKQLSDREVEDVIVAVIKNVSASGMKDMGQVMAEAMKELKGKTDGKKVQQIVRMKLS